MLIVKSAKEDIQKLVTAINDLTNVLGIQSEHYQTEKFNLEMTIKDIEKENATLLTKNNELEDRLRGSSRNSQVSSNESVYKTLVIGTNLLWNLDEGKLDHSEVRSLPRTASTTAVWWFLQVEMMRLNQLNHWI